jgi:hypothetical protein
LRIIHEPMREVIRGKEGMGWREEREKGNFALV